jgi:hypothetical protein
LEWKAERISTPFGGIEDSWTAYMATLPLAPREEAVNGQRPVIDVDFPMLKWDSIDPQASIEQHVAEYLRDPETALKVQLTV